MRDFCGIKVLRLQRYSQEIFLIKFLRISPEIPEKFLGLGHHVYGFLGEFIKRISFEKFLGISPEIPEKFWWVGHHVYGCKWEFNKRISFLGISPEFHPNKFLRNSPECFSRNFWDQVYGFLGELNKSCAVEYINTVCSLDYLFQFRIF